MNILIVTGPDITLKEPFSSGIESFVVTLASQLALKGHIVDVVARDTEANVPFNIINLGGKPFGSLDVSKYDVIHYNLFMPELYEIASAFDKPAILTLHSPVDERRSTVYRRFAQRTDVTFIAISERIKEQWDPALGVNMQVIHNGIDMAQWPIKRRRSGDYLLWSARINEIKNPLAAIRLAQYTGMPLKIVGRITDQQYFDGHVQPHLSSSIEYVGHVTQRELSKLARNASTFLATATWQEPFGLAALEMIATGVHVVGFETAVPSDLHHSNMSIVDSTDWRDLIEPLRAVGSVSPQEYRDFAAALSVQKTAQNYAALYRLLTDSTHTAQQYDPYNLLTDILLPRIKQPVPNILSPKQRV